MVVRLGMVGFLSAATLGFALFGTVLKLAGQLSGCFSGSYPGHRVAAADKMTMSGPLSVPSRVWKLFLVFQLVFGWVVATTALPTATPTASPIDFGTLATTPSGSGADSLNLNMDDSPSALPTDSPTATSTMNDVLSLPSVGDIRPLAGRLHVNLTLNGVGTAASFAGFWGIVNGGDKLFVIEYAGNTIRTVTANGTVTTLAGTGAAGYVDGAGTVALFDQPEFGVYVVDTLFVSESNNNCIRKISVHHPVTVTSFTPSTVVGYVDGPLSSAKFAYPRGLAYDSSYLYVADWGNFCVRRIAWLSTFIVLSFHMHPKHMFVFQVIWSQRWRVILRLLGLSMALVLVPSSTVRLRLCRMQPMYSWRIGVTTKFDQWIKEQVIFAVVFVDFIGISFAFNR
jgi:hypothetical protein